MESISNANGDSVLGEGRKDNGLVQGNEAVSAVHCNEEFTGKEKAVMLKTESIPGNISELRHNQIQSEDQTHPQNEDIAPTHLGEQDIAPTHPCGQTRPQNEDMVPTHPCLEGEQTHPQNEVHQMQSDGGSLQNDNDMGTHVHIQERASPASSAEDEDVLFVVEQSASSGGVSGADHVTESTNDTTEFGRVMSTSTSGAGRTNGVAEVNGMGHVTELTSGAPSEAEGLCNRDEMTSAHTVSHHQMQSEEGCASENSSIGLLDSRTQTNGAGKQDIEASGEGGGGGRVCSGDRVAHDGGDKGGEGRWKDGDVQVDKDVDKSVSRDETLR